MATDREQAARSMMQAGIGSLSGRPSRPQYETVGDQMRGEGFLETMSGKKIFPTQMNDWGINQPGWQESGITNRNLGGYKVMNAGADPMTWDWLQNLNPFTWLDKRREENELLDTEIDELYREQDETRMHPLWPAPGPWNEFDPVSGEMEYYNKMNRDPIEDIEEWTPSDEYLGGTTEVAQSRWKEMWGIMVQNLIDRGIVGDEKEANTYIFDRTGQSNPNVLPLPVLSNRGGLMSLV